MNRATSPNPAGIVARLGKREIGLIAALFCVAALILGFGLLAEEVMEGDTTAFDTRIAHVFRPVGATDAIGPAWLHEMARDVTALGSMVVLCFLLASVVGYLLLIRKRGAALLLVGSILGGTVVSFGLKLFFSRPRPDMPDGIQVFTSSFPSSHAMLSAVTFLTLGALMTRVRRGCSPEGVLHGMRGLPVDRGRAEPGLPRSCITPRTCSRVGAWVRLGRPCVGSWPFSSSAVAKSRCRASWLTMLGVE